MKMIAQLVTRGRSQVIVFPKGFRLPGKTVRLRLSGDSVLMIPEDHPDFHRTDRPRKDATSSKLEK